MIIELALAHTIETQIGKACVSVAVTSAIEIMYDVEEIDYLSTHKIVANQSVGTTYDKVLDYYNLSYTNIPESKVIEYLNMGTPVMISMSWHKSNYTMAYNYSDQYYEPKNIDSWGSKHATLIVGYNKYGYIVENSYGQNYGHQGKFILPYDIAKQSWQVSEFIIIEKYYKF